MAENYSEKSEEYTKTTDIQKTFRIKMFVLPAIFIIASFVLANLSSTHRDISQSLLSLAYTLSLLKTSTIRAVALLNELEHQDIMTWPQMSDLVNLAQTEYQNANIAFTSISNGNSQYSALATYAPSFYPPRSTLICLPYNRTICDYRVYNSSIGYTSDLLMNGIINLQTGIMPVLSAMTSALTVNGISDSSNLTLLNKVLDPDLIQGWDQVIDYVYVLEQKNLSAGYLIDAYTTVLYIAIIIVGQLVITLPTIQYLFVL